MKPGYDETGNQNMEIKKYPQRCKADFQPDRSLAELSWRFLWYFM